MSLDSLGAVGDFSVPDDQQCKSENQRHAVQRSGSEGEVPFEVAEYDSDPLAKPHDDGQRKRSAQPTQSIFRGHRRERSAQN